MKIIDYRPKLPEPKVVPFIEKIIKEMGWYCDDEFVYSNWWNRLSCTSFAFYALSTKTFWLKDISYLAKAAKMIREVESQELNSCPNAWTFIIIDDAGGYNQGVF